MGLNIRAIEVIAEIAKQESGTTYAIRRLCEALIDAGVDAQLATLRSGSRSPTPAFVKEFPGGFGPRKLGCSPQMRRWLNDTVLSGHAEIVHSHSLWRMPHVYAGWATRGQKCRLIVSPHGTMSQSAMAYSAVSKRLFWTLLQEPAYRHAACFHATAQGEIEDIRRAGFAQPICAIPLGVDVPPLQPRDAGGRRNLLFMGRIHPIKGIDRLLHAWRALSDRFADWDLLIVGPDDGGYLTKMKRLASELRLQRVVFTGPLSGEQKWRAYQEADLFVLPSDSENFGVVVAEALASGIPAIVTRGAPWPELEPRRAGWWIDVGLDPLIACLERAMSRERECLRARGARGRQWMIEDYSWSRVGKMMARTYEWLACGGEIPGWIHLN